MELELGLALPGNNENAMRGFNLNLCNSKKRDYQKPFSILPLFRLNDHDEDDDANSYQQYQNAQACYNRERVLVGCPPVNCSRNATGKRGTCVKVKMEGMVIGRKVNFSLHKSYQHLFETLNQMFPIEEWGAGPFQHWHHRRVTYEDADGDWMLAGEVPWEAFITSAKRLKILS